MKGIAAINAVAGHPGPSLCPPRDGMRAGVRSSRGGMVVVACLLMAFWVLLPVPGTGAANEAGAGLPPAPVRKSPVDYFRQLLAATGEAREQLLAARPEGQREQFRAFLREYERLAGDERERRLQALELRFQLTSILRLGAEARTQAVARLPESSRAIVAERLEYWGRLTPDVQRALLENERLLRVVTFVSAGRAGAPGGAALDSNQVGRLETAVLNWNSLPEAKRSAAEEAFKRIFEPAPGLPAKSVSPLDPAEREAMQRALDRFKNLSPTQRSQCVRNFSRLAELSAGERQAFLRSAEEWQRMSPEDREAWRSLVRRVPILPPLPQGFRLPPLPRATTILQTATNGSRAL